MVETAVDAIITIDAHGTVTTFNRAAAQLFGYPADAVVGRNVSMLMPHDVAARHDGYVAAHVAGGPASVIGRGREVVGVDSGGVELALHLSVGEMRVDGETAYVGILRDVRPEVRLRDQLRARDAEYRAVVEALDAGFIVQRADGSVQTANAAARRLFADHVQLADGVEWRLDDLHAVDEDGVAIAPTDMPVARTLATGLPTDRVPIGVGDPADRSWLELTTLPVELGSDRQRGVVTLVGDVTDRRRSELALRERESQLRLLAQNATDLVLRSSPQQVVQYASPAASTVLGRDPATLVGLHLDAILHPDDAAQLSSRLAMIDESPDVARFDARLRRGDGAWEWCEVVARAVRDADGRLSERQSSVRSIEDRRARDAALRRSLASYRALAEHLPDGAVLLVDDDLRVRLADGPAVRTLAASTDIVGEELAQALPPPVAAAVARGCRVALGGATDVWRERHPNGRTFDITCTPVNEGTHPTRAMVLAFDVTERAWLEDEQIALRTIADAVARDADPDDVLALVVTHVASLFGAVGAAVFRFDDARTATIVASAPNPPGSLTPDGRVALDGVNAVSGIAAGAGPASSRSTPRPTSR